MYTQAFFTPRLDSHWRILVLEQVPRKESSASPRHAYIFEGGSYNKPPIFPGMVDLCQLLFENMWISMWGCITLTSLKYHNSALFHTA